MAIFSSKAVIGVVFIITYLFLIFFFKKKTIIIWTSILLLLLFGHYSPFTAIKAVNWNVIVIFVTVLILSELFIYSRMPAFLATRVVNKTNSGVWAIVGVCVLTSIISIFIENVATVLLIAPVALAIARKIKMSPVPFLVAISISSNLQGAGTLIGDPPSMLLAAYTGMNFNDFFVLQSKPSIFFIIQAGALASMAVLYFLFRDKKMQLKEHRERKYISTVPSILLAGLIFLLATVSFIEPEFGIMSSGSCVFITVLGIAWYKFERKNSVKQLISKIDFETTSFLIAVFIMVGALDSVGIINDISRFIINISHGNIFIALNLVIWFSVLVSAFIDNVPYTLAMLPAVDVIAYDFGASPFLFMFGLIIGTCIGGNITPIGASANIVSMGLLKKAGYNVKFMDFVKIGFPFTIAAVLTSSLFLVLFWLIL